MSAERPAITIFGVLFLLAVGCISCRALAAEFPGLNDLNLYINKTHEEPSVTGNVPLPSDRGNLSIHAPTSSTDTQTQMPLGPPPAGQSGHHVGTWTGGPLKEDIAISGYVHLDIWLYVPPGALDAYDIELNFDLKIYYENTTGQERDTIASGKAVNGHLSNNVAYLFSIESDSSLDFLAKRGQLISVMLFYQGKGDVQHLYNSTEHPGHLSIPSEYVRTGLDIERDEANRTILIHANVTSAFGFDNIKNSTLEIIGPRGLEYTYFRTAYPNGSGNISLSWSYDKGPPDGFYEVRLRVIDAGGNAWEANVEFQLDGDGPPTVSMANVLLLFVAGSIFAIGARRIKLYTDRRRDISLVEDIFLIYRDGRLIAHETRRMTPTIDDDMLSSMLTTIQHFAADSFNVKEGNLDELRYGNLVILMENRPRFYLAVVLSGQVPEKMRDYMQGLLARIERRYAVPLEGWNGNYEMFSGIRVLLNTMLSHK